MKSRILIGAIAGLTAMTALARVAAGQAAPPPASAPAGGASGRSVWDGVYSGDQAKRGGKVYTTECVRCHGEQLEGGGEVKPLSGAGFLANWNGVSLGEMLDRTRTSMPDDNPGTLSRQQVVDVLAYLLSANKFPAGDAELPREAEALNQIRFLATKPGGQ